MSYLDFELRQLGVDEEMIAWRRWRRAHKLTLAEAAKLLPLSADYLQRAEIGERVLAAEARARLRSLMERGDESMRPARKPERRGGWQKKKAGQHNER